MRHLMEAYNSKFENDHAHLITEDVDGFLNDGIRLRDNHRHAILRSAIVHEVEYAQEHGTHCADILGILVNAMEAA